jgi:D-aminoacyl-tRNA deacylase
MYQKYLIAVSKRDKAGVNISTQLSQFGNYSFLISDGDILYNEALDKERISQFDFVIFVSKHKSEKKEKTLSVHSPGNWKNADYGGYEGKVCKSSALFQKQLLQNLNDNVGKYELNEYNVTMEATHHGPLIDKPCVFIEIGSTETEWADRRAGFIVAKTIADTIQLFKVNPYNEIAIAIGGPHYCPGFNKIQLCSNIAISHVISQYAMPLTKEIIKEAISKTDEEVDFAILDWKGLGTAEQRDEVIKILEENYIQWKKTSDVGKGVC